MSLDLPCWAIPRAAQKQAYQLIWYAIAPKNADLRRTFYSEVETHPDCQGFYCEAGHLSWVSLLLDKPVRRHMKAGWRISLMKSPFTEQQSI